MIEHADSFLDVPRLSTLQAHLIILKAREAVPKRGYYYRSWMSAVHCVAMAKDLELHEHFEDHQIGKPCGSNPAECLTKTRIWQTIFVCETMIAASQGKHLKNWHTLFFGFHFSFILYNIFSDLPQQVEAIWPSIRRPSTLIFRDIYPVSMNPSML